MNKANQNSKPFVSYNRGYDRNDKAPKWKQQEFQIDGVPGKFEVAVWERIGKDGNPYLILKIEDAVAAEIRNHQAKMDRLRKPEDVTEAAGTDGSDELQEVRKVVAGEKVA